MIIIIQEMIIIIETKIIISNPQCLILMLVERKEAIMMMIAVTIVTIQLVLVEGVVVEEVATGDNIRRLKVKQLVVELVKLIVN